MAPIAIFTDGKEPANRVDFKKDNPGKGSGLFISYKTLHSFVGVLLAGSGIRSKPAMFKTLNAMVSDESSRKLVAANVNAFLVEFIRANSFLSAMEKGTKSVKDVREQSLLTSAGALYALAHAGHELVADGMSYADAGKALGALDYSRPDANGVFKDNLVIYSADKKTGKVTPKIVASRDGWMAGGDALVTLAKGAAPAAPAKPVRRVARKSAA